MDAVVYAVIGLHLVFMIGMALTLRTFMIVVHADELLVLSGRLHTRPDGTTRGYRLLIGRGRALRVPFLESVERLSLTAVPIEAGVVATPEGPRRVHAVIGVSTDPDLAEVAVERFLGSSQEIEQVARETLRRHLEDGADVTTFEATAQPILAKLGLDLLSAQLTGADVKVRR